MYNVSFSGLVNRVFPPLYRELSPDLPKITLRASAVFAASFVTLSNVFPTIHYTVTAGVVGVSCFMIDNFFNRDVDADALYSFLENDAATNVTSQAAKRVALSPTLIKKLIELTKHNPLILNSNVIVPTCSMQRTYVPFMEFAFPIASKEDYLALIDAAPPISGTEFWELVTSNVWTNNHKRFLLLLERIKANPERFQHLQELNSHFFAWAEKDRLILLIDAGFDVNGKKPETGETALMVLAKASSFPLDFPETSRVKDDYFRNRAKLLLSLGASTTITDVNQRTALDIAKAAQRDNGVYAILKDAIAPKRTERMM